MRDFDVTAVVPTRDRRDVLVQALRSIARQDDVRVEVIVVDEGSTDGTAEMVTALGDPGVTLVRHDRAHPVGAARNAGIERASAPWVAFCDDDDLWAPGKLAAQLAALSTTGHDWCCTGAVSVDRELHVIGHHRPPPTDDVAGMLEATCCIPAGGSSVVVRTALARRLGGFDSELRACEDWDMWCRVALQSPLARVDHPLVAYRVWPGSLSTDPRLMRVYQELVVSRYRTSDLDETERRQADLALEQYLIRFLLRQGRSVDAARAFASVAVRHRLPTHLAYAVAAMIDVRRTATWFDRREREAVPAAWAAEAQAWIDDLATVQGLPA